MHYFILPLLATCLTLLELSITSGQQFPEEPTRIGVETVESDPGICPSAGDRETAINELTENAVRQLFNTQPCGGLGWRQVTFINMTDISYNCPTGFELTSFSKRTCGPPSTATSSNMCHSTIFSVNNTYSRVCGRMIGYTYFSTHAFEPALNGQTVEGIYVDGISLTHGAAGGRQHIWSFASSISEQFNVHASNQNQFCPCSALSGRIITLPPFLGTDYFCESGLNTQYSNQNRFYPDDPLWDGENCPFGTCCEFNNPPWFIKNLPNTTNDDIELRLCSADFSSRSTPIELIELYVQ